MGTRFFDMMLNVVLGVEDVKCVMEVDAEIDGLEYPWFYR